MGDDEILRCRNLARYDTPGLANAIERFEIRPRDTGFTDGSLRCLVGGRRRMVGYAVTCRLAARGEGSGLPLADLIAQLESAPRPRIVVVEDTDVPPGCGSLLGEVTGTYFSALGCCGFVTNGRVRDLPELRRLGLSVHAAGPCVSHAYVRVVEVGEPVVVGGLKVGQADLLHGDEHGVLSVPMELADRLPETVEALRASEQKTIDWVHSPDFGSRALVERGRAPAH